MLIQKIRFLILKLFGEIFSNGGKAPTSNAKQANLIGEKVDYDAPIANAYSHGKQCQNIQPNGRDKVITLNRFPVVLV